MRGIVGPGAGSIQAADTAGVEIVPVNEAVVDHYIVAAPAETPTPAAPAAPAAAKIHSHGDAHTKSPVSAPSVRRVKPTRVRIVKRRAPKVGRIVIG